MNFYKIIILFCILTSRLCVNGAAKICLNQHIDSVTVTFLGNTTLLFDDGETQIMVDGFVTRHCGFKLVLGRIKSDSSVVKDVISKTDMCRLKGIFVTHTHFDHALDVANFAHYTGATVYGSPSTRMLVKSSFNNIKVVSFQIDSTYQVGAFSIQVLKGCHTLPTKLNDNLGESIVDTIKFPVCQKKLVEGGSYELLITHHGKKCFVRSSACCTDSFKKVTADIVFLGIGRLSKETENTRQCIYQQLISDTGAKTIVPIHWDNFTKKLDRGLTPMPGIMDNAKESRKLFDCMIDQAQKSGRYVQSMKLGFLDKIKF